jgi:hypothetical protein
MADEIQRLITDGFLFTSVAQAYTILRADYGVDASGGRLQDAVTMGGGERTWQMKIDVLPDNIDLAGPVDQTQLTRAAYIWTFYQTSKQNNDAPFWFRKDDPGDDPLWTQGEREWLVSFADDNLSFTQLCARIYSTGLTLKQRALRDQEAPGEATPEDNPDKI